jgi:hypothetical protein
MDAPRSSTSPPRAPHNLDQTPTRPDETERRSLGRRLGWRFGRRLGRRFGRRATPATSRSAAAMPPAAPLLLQGTFPGPPISSPVVVLLQAPSRVWPGYRRAASGASPPVRSLLSPPRGAVLLPAPSRDWPEYWLLQSKSISRVSLLIF